jgi:DUF4097 and DUF4098 domain-containing protein YvlB
MHRTVLPLAFFAAAAFSLACGVSDRIIPSRTEERTLELKPGGQLRASTFNGRISVEGWDRDEVSLVAEIRERREGEVRFSAESKNGRVEILAERQRRSKYAINFGWAGWTSGVSYTLRVPRKTATSLVSSNGRLEVFKIDGEIDAATSNGSIAVEDIGGGARLATSNGGIRANSVNGELVARTSNSRVEAMDIQGNADLRTSNGGIDAKNVKGKVDAVTSNGTIKAESIGGDLIGNTSNGRLDVQKVQGAIDLSTSNGSIKAADLNGKGRGIRLSTSNGSIDLTRGGTEGMLEASTTDSERSIIIEVPNVQPDRDGSTMRAKIGNGGQPIRLKTTNGKITVR